MTGKQPLKYDFKTEDFIESEALFYVWQILGQTLARTIPFSSVSVFSQAIGS